MSNDFANLETPSVQVQAEPSTAKLGDLITLSVRVTHPQALAIEVPVLPKTLGTFEVYASTRLPTEISGSNAIDHFQATLQNFATGQQMLPGLDVIYRDPMGNSRAIKTSTLTVTIQEVPPGPKDKGDIRGLKGVIGPTAWSPWWWLVAGILLAAVGIVLWTKRKRALAGPPPPPPIPADVVAMDKLEKLAQTDWLDTGKSKEYYSAISDILRDYIEKGFHTMALERTTNELMRDLRKKSDFSTEHQAELREILDMCDLVKFAKFRPDPTEGTVSHAAAVKFVELTRSILRKDDEDFVPLAGGEPPKKK